MANTTAAASVARSGISLDRIIQHKYCLGWLKRYQGRWLGNHVANGMSWSRAFFVMPLVFALDWSFYREHWVWYAVLCVFLLFLGLTDAADGSTSRMMGTAGGKGESLDPACDLYFGIFMYLLLWPFLSRLPLEPSARELLVFAFRLRVGVEMAKFIQYIPYHKYRPGTKSIGFGKIKVVFDFFAILVGIWLLPFTVTAGLSTDGLVRAVSALLILASICCLVSLPGYQRRYNTLKKAHKQAKARQH